MRKYFIILICLICLMVFAPSRAKALEPNISNASYILFLDDFGRETTTTTKADSNSGMCSDDLRALLRKYWVIILYFLPPLLILMTSIDFFKAITSGDSDKLKKSSGDALKRTLAFVLLIMLKFILSTVLGWVGIDLCL